MTTIIPEYKRIQIMLTKAKSIFGGTITYHRPHLPIINKSRQDLIEEFYKEHPEDR